MGMPTEPERREKNHIRNKARERCFGTIQNPGPTTGYIGHQEALGFAGLEVV